MQFQYVYTDKFMHFWLFFIDKFWLKKLLLELANLLNKVKLNVKTFCNTHQVCLNSNKWTPFVQKNTSFLPTFWVSVFCLDWRALGKINFVLHLYNYILFAFTRAAPANGGFLFQVKVTEIWTNQKKLKFTLTFY